MRVLRQRRLRKVQVRKKEQCRESKGESRDRVSEHQGLCMKSGSGKLKAEIDTGLSNTKESHFEDPQTTLVSSFSGVRRRE